MPYASRIARLDGSGNGLVGVSPSRWAGTWDGAHAGTVTCKGNPLDSSGPVDVLDETLVSGDIEFVGGTPNAEIVFLLDLLS